MLTNIINSKIINITKDDFIDINLPLDIQKDNLYEDMFSADIKKLELILDIGWYGDFINGSFLILLIKNLNWEEPIIKIKTNNINELLIELKAVIFFIEKLNELK